MDINDLIRNKAGRQIERSSDFTEDALLDRAAVYVEKTGCSVREALDLVKAAGRAEPIKTPAGNAGEGTGGIPAGRVDMNALIRSRAGY